MSSTYETGKRANVTQNKENKGNNKDQNVNLRKRKQKKRKTNETKNCFSERTNKNDKARLIRKKETN